MRTRIFTLIAIVTILLPSLALAHPGHGTSDGYNLMHYLTSPMHLISVLLVVGASALAIRYAKSSRKQEN
ncbi:MAG: hypothetical protein KDC79_15295 [Cyclobacteriaceae bacterium]|nr:hypothetical protein [Cyclobacteriaceae bacterium]